MEALVARRASDAPKRSVPTSLLILAICLGALAPAAAHLGEPTIQGFQFPASRAEQPWLIVDNVGLLARVDDGWRWLCDEAITPFPGLNDLAPVDAGGSSWLAATRSGLYLTTDTGCSFAAVDLFADDVVGHVVPHPARADEALVTTQTLPVSGQGERTNDIWRTVDGGASWAPAGLALTGRVRSIVRSPADPQVVYAVHSGGAVRSDDGGATFAPIALAHVEDAIGADVELLAADPDDPRVAYSALAGFPDSDLLRTADGGETWAAIARFPDLPTAMAIEPGTGRMLITMPFEGLRRSDDGGATWAPVPLPEPGAVFDCLAWHAGEIWACVRRGAPYTVARSADLGETWTGDFAADYSAVVGGWGCLDDSPTAAACADACDRSARDCSGAEVDAGMDDAGVRDAAPETGDDPPAESGCRAAPAAPHSPAGPTAVVALVVVAIRRRRPARV